MKSTIPSGVASIFTHYIVSNHGGKTVFTSLIAHILLKIFKGSKVSIA